jgi:hypothetical protein
MRYAHLNVECPFLKKLFFSQKWSYLIKCPGQTSHESISKVIFFLSGFIRLVRQAQIFNFWTSTFEKITKTLKKFRLFWTCVKLAELTHPLKKFGNRILLEDARKSGTCKGPENEYSSAKTLLQISETNE